jgi:replicative DNA helicase
MTTVAVAQPVAREDAQLVALKVPPHSVEAEQSLIGALLLDNQAFDKVADVVTAEDFYRDDHRRIFRHVSRLIEHNRPADMVTVAESIEASEDKDKTGGAAYLASLAQSVPSARCSARLPRWLPRSPSRRSRRTARKSA